MAKINVVAKKHASHNALLRIDTVDEWRHRVNTHKNYQAPTDNAIFRNVKQSQKNHKYVPGLRSP